jgi:2-aminoadipate transaminase
MLIERHSRQGLEIKPGNLAISTGSQQALDILGKIMIDPGDYIICGLPSYLGGISAFNVYGAKMKGISFDEKGMKADELEEAVARLLELGKKVKFIYIIPDFQNPAGITMPESRRKEILEIAEKYNLLIIEDSPYREIRFEGEHQKLVYELDNSGRVITLFTFSKIFAPGFRIAWLIGHEELIDKFIMAKQSADICSPVIVQKIAAEYIKRGLLDKNLVTTIELYRKRRDKMLDSFEKHMPAEVSWTHPEGGLFLFLTLPEHMNADEVFVKAVENNVAFVKGSVFYCNDTGKNTLRMNFSYANEDQIEEGIKRLSRVIKQML